jgi:hypothetical protein
MFEVRLVLGNKKPRVVDCKNKTAEPSLTVVPIPIDALPSSLNALKEVFQYQHFLNLIQTRSWLIQN